MLDFAIVLSQKIYILKYSHIGHFLLQLIGRLTLSRNEMLICFSAARVAAF